jgi:hypothetical protein
MTLNRLATATEQLASTIAHGNSKGVSVALANAEV